MQSEDGADLWKSLPENEEMKEGIFSKWGEEAEIVGMELKKNTKWRQK